MTRVLVEVKSYLAQHCPSVIWNKKYATAIGWETLTIVEGPAIIRGLSYYNRGHIELRLNQSTRWMNNSGPASTLNGQEDLTPVGVLAHELGHQYECALRRHCGKEAAELFKEYEALQLKTAVSHYGGTDLMEDWAEAYRIYLLNPKLLQRISPQRTALFDRADDLLHSKRGFTHGPTRTLPNINFAMTRLEEILTKEQQ